MVFENDQGLGLKHILYTIQPSSLLMPLCWLPWLHVNTTSYRESFWLPLDSNITWLGLENDHSSG